jgi:hypothetical protein
MAVTAIGQFEVVPVETVIIEVCEDETLIHSMLPASVVIPKVREYLTIPAIYYDMVFDARLWTLDC